MVQLLGTQTHGDVWERGRETDVAKQHLCTAFDWRKQRLLPPRLSSPPLLMMTARVDNLLFLTVFTKWRKPTEGSVSLAADYRQADPSPRWLIHRIISFFFKF